MASSSRPTTSRPTSPTHRHSRIADAVQVAPYLTHVVRHHGQVTLIPPENSGRIRKAKKKRPAVRVEGSACTSTTDLPRTRTPASRSRPHSSSSVRASQTIANDTRNEAFAASRGHQTRDELSFPDFPPPSFEEAMLAAPSPNNSTPGSQIIEEPPLPERTISSEQEPSLDPALPPVSPPNPVVVPCSSDAESLHSSSSHSSLEETADLRRHSIWEQDREAGFSLEERVQRELERRRLADSLPHAPLTRVLDHYDASSDKEASDEGSQRSREKDSAPARRVASRKRPMPSVSHGKAASAPDLREIDQVGQDDDFMPSFPGDVRPTEPVAGRSDSDHRIPHMSSKKGKEKEGGHVQASGSKVPRPSLNKKSSESALSKVCEVLNMPLRSPIGTPDLEADTSSIPPSKIPLTSGRPSANIECLEPFSSHNSSTLHTVSDCANNSNCIHTSTDAVLAHPSPQPGTSDHSIPPLASCSYSSTPSLSFVEDSHSSIPTKSPLPPNPKPPSISSASKSLSRTRRVPPPIPSTAVSVRDRISAFESLQSRPVPPPPPPRTVTRRPPPPVPRSPIFSDAQVRARAEEQTHVVENPDTRHETEEAPQQHVRRRPPPPSPPRLRARSRNSIVNDFGSQAASSSAQVVGVDMTVSAAVPPCTDEHVRPTPDLVEENFGRPDSPSGGCPAVAPSQSSVAEVDVPLAVSVSRTDISVLPCNESRAPLEVSTVNSTDIAPGDDGGTGGTSQSVAATEEAGVSDVVAHAYPCPPHSNPASESAPRPSSEGSQDHGESSTGAIRRHIPPPDLTDDSTSAMQPMRSLQPMFTGLTDLDLLLARLDDPDFTFGGRSYDDLLLLEEIMGPASVTSNQPRTNFEDIPLGKVEVLRRRVTKDGRTKLKLALLGVVVDKCGICLVQFKDGVFACLLPCCHAFHENCLRLWMRRGDKCPLCRGAFV